jgi:predicted nucleic acid-binding protein
MKNLLDASALMTLVKKADAQTTAACTRNSVILDLTFYEVGNAIWKESTLTNLLKADEAERLEIVAHRILAKLEKLTIQSADLSKILKIAKLEKTTFYDSSYIYYAKENKLTLVTEDKALKTKANKTIKTITTAQLLTI